jgi:4-methyl-5(b-hydroxyethyl)-thiazole monophosphate biosynthesis
LCVKGAHGVEIKADVLLSEVSGDDFAAVVLPGGAGGTEKLRVCDVLKDILWRHKENGAIIAAICAAPIVLVDFELLDREHHITCYPSVVTEIDRPSANAPVVADGNVITGQGPASAMLFALVLLSALEGEVKARKVSRGVLFDGF